MKTRFSFGALIGVLCLATAASGQDLPYYQEQRLVVIFNIDDDMILSTPTGTDVRVLEQGRYRFDATQRSQSVLTEANFADGTGPYVQYGGSLYGEVTPIGGGTAKPATIRIQLTDADFSLENKVRGAEMTLEFRVDLGSGSSTVARHEGTVAHDGASHVVGTLESPWQWVDTDVEVEHVKLTLEDHLPILQPIEYFPDELEATVTPTPFGDHIESGPYGFKLNRAEITDLGVVWYDSDPQFAMRHENDFYGHYVSTGSRTQVVIQEDGDVFVSVGWHLSGRYHGWSHTYTAVLSDTEFDRLRNEGSVTVTGKAVYDYSGEDDAFEDESTCEILLKTGALHKTMRGRIRIDNDGSVVMRNRRKYRIEGLLRETLRAFEGDRVTATGVVRIEGTASRPLRRFKVESFVTELSADANAFTGTGVENLSQGTEVEVFRVFGGLALARIDDNGTERTVSLPVSAILPAGAASSGLSGSVPGN